MDNTREKLIELLSKCFPKNITILSYDDNFTVNIKQGNIADYLIANGVTLATDNHVGDKTHADRIRAMSDEELAEFLYQCEFCDLCNEGCDACTYNGYCDKRLLDWLKQPVGDENG